MALSSLIHASLSVLRQRLSFVIGMARNRIAEVLRTNQTGTSSINAYDVAPDASASVTVDGTAVPVSVTSPGQNANVTFAGAQGQQATVHLTGNTVGTSGGSPMFGVKNPNGSWLTWTWSGASAFDMSLGTLGSTGTYTVVVDPQMRDVGTVTVQVTSP